MTEDLDVFNILLELVSRCVDVLINTNRTLILLIQPPVQKTQKQCWDLKVCTPIESSFVDYISVHMSYAESYLLI